MPADQTYPEIAYLEVTGSGLVYLEFSEKLKKRSVEDVSQTALLLKIISMTEVPREKKTFSWKALSFTAEEMTLRIEFDEPFYISSESNDNLDVLEVTILDRSLFISESTGLNPLFGTSSEAEIPKQIPEGSAATIEGTLTAATTAVATAFSYSAVKIVLEGSLSFFWGLINAIQVLSYIYYLRIYLPANADAFLAELIKIAEF